MAQAFDQQTPVTEVVQPSSVTRNSEPVYLQSTITPPIAMPQSSRSPRSIRSPEDTRLSVIEEDSDIHEPGINSPPAVPLRSTHRPFVRRWRDSPPRASSDLKPPEYSILDESKHQRDRLAELRNKPVVIRRGGWKRLLLIVVVVVLILAIALGLGLGIGLRNRQQVSSVLSDGSSPSVNGSDLGFPLGKYAINAFLNTVDTSCTSNAATFRCYPYSVYAISPSQSAVSFNWIISGSAANYMISSSDNPFAITFSNASLVLQDAGTASERYYFSLRMNKIVVPSSSLTGSNSAAECFFNGTVLSAALYTKRGAVKVTGMGTGDSQSTWQPWPFATEVNQTISGGQEIPACYEMTNGVLGSPITTGLTAQPSNTQCGCFWKNFDL